MLTWLVVLAVAVFAVAVVGSILSTFAAARRKWRDVRGIKRRYWFDDWIL